jgi:CheY-like chemotaxis protein
MHRQVRTLGRLVADLLEVTRISRGKVQLELRPVDLVDVVQAEYAVHEQGAGERLSFVFTAPQGPVWVRGDPDRIAQMAGNLLANACKFSDRGGRVEIVVAAATDGRPELIVRDVGIGMTAETVAHLFEPFRQADHSIDRHRGGLGLGLSLVKGMATLMGAEVEARSDGLGRGSEFRVRFLPAAVPAPPAAVDVVGQDAPPARLRILVVEDNPDVREMLVELLSDGHDVEAKEDGESGLACASAWKPDVIFCDIGLPRLDGYDFARLARERPELSRTVLVAMTGYGGDADKARASSCGFDHHFTKPVDARDLERFLATLPRV